MKVSGGLNMSNRWHLPVRPEVNLLYVRVEVSFAEEAVVAEVAALLKVYLLVPGELAALRRGVVAHGALVGLLPRVGPPVDSQVGEVDEDLAAILARVPPRDHAAFGPHTRLHRRRGGQPGPGPGQPRDPRDLRDPGPLLHLQAQPRVVVHHPL